MADQLSPANQVMIAVAYVYQEHGGEPPARAVAAAALRAVADQVVPELDEPDWGACNEMHCDIELYTDHQRKRAALLAIATELENHQ